MEVGWGELITLFAHAIAAALVVGLVAPLLGALLYLRRSSFEGIALPQVAACGVAFGFVLLPWWVEHVGLGGLDPLTALQDTHAAMNYHITWASLFTFGALGLLSLPRRRGTSDTARVAALLAIASALTVLFVHASPIGESYVGDLLRGEILTIDVHQLETVAVAYGLILLAFVVFRRELLAVNFDRESSIVLGKRVRVIESGQTLLFGLGIAVGTMTVGPMILFGLLVLPPLAARPFARSMTSFWILSSAFGLFSVLGGIWVSFEIDEPWGPSVVAVSALGLLPGAILRRRT